MTEPTYPGAEAAERAAAMLTAAGMPRMSARVMMALVGSPDEGYSAAELAERLGVSAAAVSGAVRYLQSIHIVHRLSRAGDRRDRYDLIDDGWHSVLTANAPLYRMLADLIDAVADENPGAPLSNERAREMSAFFRFFADRMPAFLDEWDAERRARSDADQASGTSVTPS
ncbi:GbsR/MarR family transcriptional regulator [Microbacterium pumilum]|uniref:MarR family transcriptional regulator n=1 Tax=Microbacterium pumilum TaxID=344165 RepID=A0ABP5D7D7_9MICO